MEYQHIPYLKEVSIKLKDLGHTEASPKFARVSGLAQLDEFLTSMGELESAMLLAQDNQDGNLGDQSKSDNFLDTPYFVFYIAKHAAFQDYDAQQAAKEECKTIGFKIFSKMVREKRLGLNGLTFLDFTSVPYQTIGPIGDNCVAVMFSYSVTDIANITYNANDWNQ